MSTRKWGDRCLSVSPKPRMPSRHFSPVGADIAQQNCFHRGFSDRAEYQCVFPRGQNLLWRQRSSDITSKRARTEPLLKKCLISVWCVYRHVSDALSSDTGTTLLSQDGLSNLLKIRQMFKCTKTVLESSHGE